MTPDRSIAIHSRLGLIRHDLTELRLMLRNFHPTEQQAEELEKARNEIDRLLSK